jgi:cation diffusion facilitator family transporter
MTTHTHSHHNAALAHSHSYAEGSTARRERALLWVVAITLLTMAAELVAGWWSGSLALTADGWHMGTHALALGGAVLAYRLSQRAANGPAYAFGGWKIEVLTAYTSGLALLAAAVWLVFDSVMALQAPRSIAYGEAASVAVVGLLVNLASAWLLMRAEGPTAAQYAHGHQAHGHRGHGHHGHHHGHSHHHGPAPTSGATDHNFNAATLHVMADAFTSVLALVALAGGAVWGLSWLDPVVALLGAIVIAHWSIGVVRASARALVDATADPALAAQIQGLIESDGDAKVADLHVWQVGASAWCAALSVVADAPLAASVYRERLTALQPLRHVTVEVHTCTGTAH